MSMKVAPGVLKIEGLEARKFLHALVSSDVNELSEGNSQRSLLLTPAGKLIGAFWIYGLDEETFLLICEKVVLQQIQENLSRFLIRTKAKIEEVSTEYTAVVGFKDQNDSNTYVIEPNYLSVGGLILALRHETLDGTKSNDQDDLNNFRISHGALSNSSDLVNEIIPQEGNLQNEAVSFTKGCFLGQELVCRIDSRQATTPFSIFAFETADSADDELATYTAAKLFVNSEEVAPITSLLKPDDQFIKRLSESQLKLGKYVAIARIPRKTVDLLSNSQNEIVVTIRSEVGTTNLKAISWKKVEGNFSI